MKEYILTEIRNTLFGKISNEEISTVIDSTGCQYRNLANDSLDIWSRELIIKLYD